MKNTQDIKIRLSLNLTSELVGYDKLFNELADIEAKYGEGTPLAGKMRRKHLIGILHLYCNNGFTLEPETSFRTPEQAKQIAMSPNVPTLPPDALDAEVSNQATAAIEAVTNPNLDTGDDGLGIKNRLQKDGSYKFGNLYVD